MDLSALNRYAKRIRPAPSREVQKRGPRQDSNQAVIHAGRDWKR